MNTVKNVLKVKNPIQQKNDTMDEKTRKETEALAGEYNGLRADDGNRSYDVLGWYCDPSGCLKTYGDGFSFESESFISDTSYS